MLKELASICAGDLVSRQRQEAREIKLPIPGELLGMTLLSSVSCIILSSESFPHTVSQHTLSSSFREGQLLKVLPVKRGHSKGTHFVEPHPSPRNHSVVLWATVPLK